MTMISLILCLLFRSFLFVSWVIFRNVCSIGFKQFRMIYIQPSNNTKRTRKSFQAPNTQNIPNYFLFGLRLWKNQQKNTRWRKRSETLQGNSRMWMFNKENWNLSVCRFNVICERNFRSKPFCSLFFQVGRKYTNLNNSRR